MKPKRKRPTLLPEGTVWDNPQAMPLVQNEDIFQAPFFPLLKGDMVVVRTGVADWADASDWEGLPPNSMWVPPSGLDTPTTQKNARVNTAQLEQATGKKLAYGQNFGWFSSDDEHVTSIDEAIYVITDVEYGDWVPGYNWWRKPGMTDPGMPLDQSWNAALAAGEGAKNVRWTTLNMQMEEDGVWAEPGDSSRVESFSPFTIYMSHPFHSAVQIVRDGKTVWTP